MTKRTITINFRDSERASVTHAYSNFRVDGVLIVVTDADGDIWAYPYDLILSVVDRPMYYDRGS